MPDLVQLLAEVDNAYRRLDAARANRIRVDPLVAAKHVVESLERLCALVASARTAEEVAKRFRDEPISEL